MNTAPPPPAPSKPEKAMLLATFYNYLAGRIDSVGRRSSLLMAFLASFLAFATSPVLKSAELTHAAKLEYALSHPSILLGIAGMAVFLWLELARVKPSDDLFTKIAFTELELGPLQEQYVSVATDPLFREAITSIRVVGGFLRKKIKMFNAGAVLFAASVTLYALGF